MFRYSCDSEFIKQLQRSGAKKQQCHMFNSPFRYIDGVSEYRDVIIPQNLKLSTLVIPLILSIVLDLCLRHLSKIL